MSWLGKVIGGAFGFLMGGPLGALLGTALGHQYDAGKRGQPQTDPRLESGDQQRVQMAFFTATFSVMGHLAKTDGTVSRAEIDAARSVMNRLELSEELRQTAIQLFSEGKKPNFPLHQALEQFRLQCHRRPSLLRLFIQIQLETAYADGPLRPAEERLLLQICDRVHVSRFDFFAIKARIEAEQRMAQAGYHRTRHRTGPPPPLRKPPIENAYAVLGLRPSATAEEIKRAYRRLMGQHHPDRLAANGLPEEMVRVATEKTQQIRKAYELIAETRKL
ncbi:MAG: co-chaperone DjlA [Methylotetracoccus sp.]|nr:co-chaperone DjlA [Methylotetracoccus sp.]